VGLAASLMVSASHAAGFASVMPTERIEYWQQRQVAIAEVLKDPAELGAVRLVFVGDSITDFWLLGDDPWVKGWQHGRRIWDETFGGAMPENRALNLGISGDRIEHVLHRLLPRSAGGLGQLDPAELDPEFFAVMIGINNTWAAEEPVVDSVFEGVRALLVALHERRPKARIILQSLLPTSDSDKNRDVVSPVNRRLVQLADTAAFSAFTSYLDLYPAFLDPSGRQLAGYFTDGLHPNEAGYRVWRDRLVPFLRKVRASAAGAAR
jgi:lysophospholipase L1-like esterase